jgi:hypothetical protein
MDTNLYITIMTESVHAQYINLQYCHRITIFALPRLIVGRRNFELTNVSR